MATVDISLSSGATVEVSPKAVPTIEVTPANINEITVQGYAVNSEVTQGDPGVGVPDGGDRYQVIVKQSSVNYDTEWEYPDKILFQVRNESVDRLVTGSLVYALGEVGSSGVIRVDLADCSDSSKMPAIGIVMDDILPGANGLITAQGIYSRNLNGYSGFVNGQKAYVSTSGTITPTKPVYPNLIQNIGTVLDTNGVNVQEMKISSIDRSNDVPNLPDGKFFQGSSTNTVTSAYALPTSVGTNGQVLQSDGTNVVFADASSGTDISTIHNTSFVIIQSSTGSDDTLDAATSGAAGVMTSADKIKLDGIATGAEVNVQSDWTETNSAVDSFILNKPTIPTIIDDLTDATVFAATQGQVLIRNSSGVFVNGDLVGGTGITITDTVDGEITIANTFTQYTDADARAAISVTDSGGDGSLSYDNTTGVITYTGPSAAEVQAHFTGGTGIGLTAGDISVDTDTTFVAAQATDDVSLTVTGPSGVADAITLQAGDNITLTETTGNVVDIAVSPGTFVDELNDLTDVTVSAETTNDYLVHNGSVFVNQQLDISHDTTPQLGGTLDANGNIIDMGTNTITDTKVGQWDTAYGWGNHATVGYLEDGDFTSQGIMLRGATSGSYSITPNNSILWDVAVTWGNHATAGYLTDITGESIKDLSDVYSSMSPTDGQVLTYDTTNGWQAEDATGGVDTAGTPADDQIAVFTDADTIEGSSNLTFSASRFYVNGDADFDGHVSAEEITIDDVDSPGSAAAGAYGRGTQIIAALDPLTATTRGDVYCLSGSWAPADADAESTSKGLLGVATGTTAGAGMILKGIVRMLTNTNFSAASVGDPLYLDTVAGDVTKDAPTGAGDVVRVVGYVVDPTNKIIYFDPSKDWILRTT